MKKNIILKILIIIELALVLFFGLGSVFSFFKDTPVLNVLYILGNQLFVFGRTFASLLHINLVIDGISYTNFTGLIGFVIINVIFIALYYGIWYLVSFIVNKHNEDKLRSVVEKYELTKSEKARFQLRNYIHTFSPYVFISLIIPIVFFFVIITARFDSVIAKEASSKLNGTLHIYTNNIEPALNTLFLDNDFHKIILNFFTRSSNNGYIDIMNVWFSSVPWVEYILIVFGVALILFIWFILFQALYLLVRKPIAKIKCDNARKAYIYKMEHQEYKIRKEYKNEVSSKSDDFIRTLEEEVNSSAKNIANITTEEDEELLKNPKSFEKNRRAYLEDIGYGVSDLGVSLNDIEKVKPIVEREVRYISDEDIDIILEEEPVIEVTEEEQDISLEESSNDEFYEKYIPEEQEIEDIKPLSEDVAQYIFENISNDDLIKEDALNQNEEIEDVEKLDSLEGSLPNEEQITEEEIQTEDTQESEINNEPEEVESVVIEETNNQEQETPIEDEKLVTDEETKQETSIEEEELATKEDSNEEETLIEEALVSEEAESPIEEKEVITEEETPVSEEEPKVDEEKEDIKDLIVIEEVKQDIPVEEEKLEDVDSNFQEVEEVTNIVYQEDIEKEDSIEQQEVEETPIEIVPEEMIVPQENNVEESETQETNKELDQEQEVEITSEEEIKIPQKTTYEEKPIKPKKEKYNPFLKYFNPRTKGYGAKKVPSFKQLAEDKQKNKK